MQTHFNQSRVDQEVLSSKQELLDIPKHSLIKYILTRWDSTHDMIKRLCEQQPSISIVLHCRRDLLHLEISPEEWRILEDITELLKPYNSDNDSVAVRSVKSLLAADTSTQYQSIAKCILTATQG